MIYSHCCLHWNYNWWVSLSHNAVVLYIVNSQIFPDTIHFYSYSLGQKSVEHGNIPLRSNGIHSIYPKGSIQQAFPRGTQGDCKNLNTKFLCSCSVLSCTRTISVCHCGEYKVFHICSAWSHQTLPAPEADKASPEAVAKNVRVITSTTCILWCDKDLHTEYSRYSKSYAQLASLSWIPR